MDQNQKYSCTSEIGAEVLMAITSFIILVIVYFSLLHDLLSKLFRSYRKNFIEKILGIFLPATYALFLPLISFLFSQAKQNNPERCQFILIWAVFLEVILVLGGDSIWELKKSAEQVVRLVWVGFLVYGYTSLNLFRVSLLVLCVCSIVFELQKGITFYQALDSYLLGKNPKLMQNYMERVTLQDDLKTTPMNNCDHIVMGEENHEIAVCKNGYSLHDKILNSKQKLTVGRVFQDSLSEDEAFTLAHPGWRDTCLSFALAKILRRRFVNLPLIEAGSSKALQFVLEGLIDYIGGNKDIHEPVEERYRKRNPDERVFSIIQDELKFVSEFLHTKIPTRNYFGWHFPVYLVSLIIMMGITMYITVSKNWENVNIHQFRGWTFGTNVPNDYAHSHCIILTHSTWMYYMYIYDKLITGGLGLACFYIQSKWLLAVLGSKRWSTLRSVKQYIENPAKWNKSHGPMATSTWRLLHEFCGILFMPEEDEDQDEVRIHRSIFDLKVQERLLGSIVRWIKRNIPRLFLSTVVHNTDVKEAILRSLQNSGGQLTNGETALRNHRMLEHLNRVCQPSASITEAILVWHIATTLFHHQEDDDTLKKDRWVALNLSNYCFYLMEFLPELLPDEVEWTEQMIESVRQEMFAIDCSSGQKPTAINRCNYAIGLDVIWDEKSMVGKGAKLAKELVNYADNGTEVWTILSEFWAEMMLFIAPSDNVKGHVEILEKGEFITQLWALLTHAGVLTRPKHTEHPNHEMASCEITEDMIV